MKVFKDEFGVSVIPCPEGQEQQHLGCLPLAEGNLRQTPIPGLPKCRLCPLSLSYVAPRVSPPPACRYVCGLRFFLSPQTPALQTPPGPSLPHRLHRPAKLLRVWLSQEPTALDESLPNPRLWN